MNTWIKIAGIAGAAGVLAIAAIASNMKFGASIKLPALVTAALASNPDGLDETKTVRGATPTPMALASTA